MLLYLGTFFSSKFGTSWVASYCICVGNDSFSWSLGTLDAGSGFCRRRTSCSLCWCLHWLPLSLASLLSLLGALCGCGRVAIVGLSTAFLVLWLLVGPGPLATSLELGWLLSWNQGWQILLSTVYWNLDEHPGFFRLPFRPGVIIMQLWNG